uniref:Ig domain protein, group 2 domain protein n=1 Tax=Solibacter usitatus (strain Ellin6076) TaxID=234267 RepID=Q01XJ9_SOLUE
MLLVALLFHGVAVGQRPTVTVSPATVSLTNSQTQQFSATATGAASSDVTWSVSPALGGISKTGLYTAPAGMAKAQTVIITATSAGSPPKSGTAMVSLVPTPAAVSVSVSPSTASLSTSGSQQFTAAVSGVSNASVTWSVNPAVGSVSSTGLYTAPATLPSAQTVTLTATSVANSAVAGKATLTITPPVSVSVTPASTSLSASQSSQFTATVSGSSNTAVNWSVSPSVGVVSSTGFYTAPASISIAQIVTVAATSAADPTKSASASITLAPTVTVSVTPTATTLKPAQSQQLTAVVTGSSNAAVNWSMSPSVGGLTSSGATAIYTAPSSLSSSQNVTITATPMANPTKSASAIFALVQAVAVAMSPTSVTLRPSSSQQFTAQVTGSSNASVNWSISPALGTIDSTGRYVAPASVLTAQTVTVTAQSVADPTQSASGIVALAPPVTVSLSPTNAALTISETQQFAATVSGSSNSAVTWTLSPAVGSISASGLYTAPASLSGLQTVTVTATSATDSTKSASATVALAPVSISVAPLTVSLSASQTQQFATRLRGTSNGGVTWSLSPNVGTIASNGVYIAPAAIPSAQNVTVIATSAADPTQSASAVVSLVPSVTVSLTPTSVSLTGSQWQQFTATVGGSSNSGVTWSVSPAVGSLSSAGLYTAPATIAGAQSVTVTATSVADPTKSANASVALTPTVTVSVTPATVSLGASQTQQFTATVGGSANTGVTWSVSPAVGTVSSTGLYTAPASIASTQSVTVTATSVADPTKSASASVALAPSVTVSVTPTSVSLGVSQTQQFAVTVGGVANTGVTWSVSPAVGTVSSTGLYTAPVAISNPQSVTVTATSVADPSKAAGANVALAPTVTVSVTPASVSLGVSQTQQFTATVGGSANTGVIWSLRPIVGTISNAGVYTAPNSIAGAQTVTVTATSSADASKSASAAIALASSVTVSVTPSIASLTPLQIQQLTASVSGTSNTAVAWSLSPAVGTISTAGLSAVYNPPGIIEASQTVEIDATSMADTTKIAKALFTLVPAILISATPSVATLTAGQTQQFTAQVLGTSNTAVTWSLDQAVGSLSPTGLYTAPSPILADQALTLTAQSVADPTKSVRIPVNLRGASQLQYTVDANRLTSLSYNGQSFYQYVDSIVQGARFRAPDGTITDAGWSKPNKSTFYPALSAFEEVYNLGGPFQFTLRVTWTKTDDRTLKAVATFTNNDPVNALITIGLHILSVNLPGPATQYNQNIPLEANQYNGIPVTFLNGSWGSVALWQSGYPTPAEQISYYSSATQTSFSNILSSATTYGPRTYSIEVPPGQTGTMAQSIRFGSASDTAVRLAPDAYAEYTAAFPSLVNWPDRHPISMWMISDGGNRSKTNPRGYLWDSTIDVSNSASFQAHVLAAADNTISILNGMAVRPQGVLVWDLEGQEFKQPFTYIGYPNKLPDLAPEMDAVADALMTKIKSAGYRVGVTIRPNHFATGTSLPPSCVSDPNYSLWDKFILLTASFPYRGYVCSAENTWEVSQANGPTAQTTTQSYSDVLALLTRKISYAHDRWGATLFYVDSNVWEGGPPIDHLIFRILAAQFPDCLIIPEMENTAYYASTAPYAGQQGDYWAGAALARALYPSAFQIINIADVDLSINQTFLTNAVAEGDILMFRGWFPNKDLAVVQTIYSAAGVK